MAKWKESDHPRHPGGSPGRAGGRFREQVGGAGWAARLAGMLGRGRTRTVRREHGPIGGRGDLYEYDESPETNQQLDDIAMVTDHNMGGMTAGRTMGVRLESLGSQRAHAALMGMRDADRMAVLASMGASSDSDRGRETQSIIDKIFPDEYRARLRASAADERARRDEIQPRAGTFIGNVPETHGNARPMDEGGNLPRLTNQDVADALAPSIGDMADLVMAEFEFEGREIGTYPPPGFAQHLGEIDEWAGVDTIIEQVVGQLSPPRLKALKKELNRRLARAYNPDGE